MSANIKDIILSSKVGKIGVLLFSIYTFTWAIVEPLGLDWIDSHKELWRILLLVFAAIVALLLSINLSSKILDKLTPDGPDRTLQDSYSSTGNPQVMILQDGNFGNVVNIKGQYDKDELDWSIKISAQKSKRFEIIFKNSDAFYFYLKVTLLSQDRNVSKNCWIRFDNRKAIPDTYRNSPIEMAIPYDSMSLHSFNKAIINIPDAVKRTYVQGGWTYNKLVLLRIRCYDGTIKSVSFKK